MKVFSALAAGLLALAGCVPETGAPASVGAADAADGTRNVSLTLSYGYFQEVCLSTGECTITPERLVDEKIYVTSEGVVTSYSSGGDVIEEHLFSTRVGDVAVFERRNGWDVVVYDGNRESFIAKYRIRGNTCTLEHETFMIGATSDATVEIFICDVETGNVHAS